MDTKHTEVIIDAINDAGGTISIENNPNIDKTKLVGGGIHEVGAHQFSATSSNADNKEIVVGENTNISREHTEVIIDAINDAGGTISIENNPNIDKTKLVGGGIHEVGAHQFSATSSNADKKEIVVGENTNISREHTEVIIDAINNAGGTIISIENHPNIDITKLVGGGIHEVGAHQFSTTSSNADKKEIVVGENTDISREAYNTLNSVFDEFIERNQEIPSQHGLLESILIESEIQADGSLPLTDPKFIFATVPKTKELNQDSPTKSKNILDDSKVSNSIHVNAKSKVGSCDNVTMIVQTSDLSKKDKKLCCVYCHKAVAKLARHLEYVHKNEVEVEKFRHLPKGCKERRDILDTLRKAGTFDWNTNSTLNNGLLITSRRPNRKLEKSAKDYTTCPKCLGTFAKTSIRHHTKKCLDSSMNGERQIFVLGRAIEGRLHSKASDRLRLKVFPVLKEDEIVRLIRYDWLIILFGNKLCVKYTAHFHENYIRSQLRLAGRLLLTLKTMNANITDFASMYDPLHCDSVGEAIRKVAGYDPIKNEYVTPKTASTAVTLVKQIGVMLATEYIKKKDSENKTNTEDFMKVMNSEINATINKAVSNTQDRMRRERKDNIPTNEDIKRFSEYIDLERRRSFAELQEKYSLANWIELSELTVASIIVFNRRRTGETQNILSKEFLGRQICDEKAHLFVSLTDQAKKIAKKYSRMNIRGKKGRDVKALLTPEIDNCIQLLLEHRKKAGVSSENNYLFALPTRIENRIRVVNACTVLCKLSKLCGANNPKSLRGTNMRKHIATMCAYMKLDDNGVAEVADFMGHSEKIHREYYRKNPVDRQVVTISKLLEAGRGKHNSEIDNTITQNDMENEGPSSIEMVEESTGNVDNEESKIAKRKKTPEESEEPKIAKRKKTSEESEKPKIDKRKKTSKKSEEPKIAKRKKTSEESEEPVPKPKYPKKKWNDDELLAVRTAFRGHLELRKLPSLEEMLECKKKNKSCLRSRTVAQIKAWVNNQNKKLNR